MGSALRYGYTALGDTVNLSSRLEGLNKDYGTHIIVNETTYAATQNANFVYRELDLIRVKGKSHPVLIYELICRQGEDSAYGSAEDLQKRAGAIAFAKPRPLSSSGAGSKHNGHSSPSWIDGPRTGPPALTGSVARNIYSTSRPWDGTVFSP